jgi:hypothetical protein
MNDPAETNDGTAGSVGGVASRWDAPSTSKERTAVQRAVDRLLDALAPARVVTRATQLPTPIKRHRTPRGCVLQAATAAVSVSWFPDAGQDVMAGELHVAAWRGVVSQPGATRRVSGATVARELVLRPVGRGGDPWAWQTADGTTYDAQALAALCLTLLEAQASDGAPGAG